MKYLVTIAALMMSTAAFAADKTTLDDAHQTQFINALADVSMPAKAYQQIVNIYQQLLKQQNEPQAGVQSRVIEPGTTPEKK